MTSSPNPLPRLDGRNILITGASRGLGRATAGLLWRAGANVALVSRPGAALEETVASLSGGTPGQQRFSIGVDLGEPWAPDAIAAALSDQWETVDGLINNAGTIGPIGELASSDWSEWEAAIRVNLLVPVALCRLLIGRMRPGSAIVNLSGGGATSPRPNFGAYATAKAGLVRFTENLAVELAGQGIRVNAVAPGAMNTQMLEAVLEAGAGAAGAEFGKAVEQKQKGGVPPEKAAELVAWLVSPASEGISGRLISAVWDPWPSLAGRASELGDIYTLRRITPEDRGKKWDR
jgi:NAD(P)-dependent dehydrogenase (short-subunit alcohol dehydrogenase family)